MGMPRLRHKAVCAKARGRGVVWMRGTRNPGQPRGWSEVRAAQSGGLTRWFAVSPRKGGPPLNL